MNPICRYLLNCTVCAAALFLTVVSGAGAAELVVADFENDVSDFTGPIVHDATAQKGGAASGRIDADFSQPGDPWVTVGKAIEIKNELKSVSLWVKSADFTGLTIRFVDSTGQNHQQRPTFAADGQWHEIVINTLDAGVGYEKFGGANDGKFHWPVTGLAIIAEKGKLGGKAKGIVWVDQVTFDVIGELPKPVELIPVAVADFEADAGGFIGALQREAGEAKTGKGFGKIEADFSKPGDPWVVATRELAMKNDAQQLRFWVKSSEAKGITVRMIDSTGQVHQQRPTFAADGQWHQITIKKLTGGPGYERWGGAADGQFHSPATTLGFILEKPALGGKTAGSVLIDDVELLVDPNSAVPKAEMEQKQLGNVFLTTETPEVRLHTQADNVKWSVTDFWNNPVASGATKVEQNYANIQPGKNLRGWYKLDIVAEKSGQELAKLETTFSVITPIAMSEVADSPFGVMTHFAQNWDTDIMPLIAKAGISTIRDELYWEQVEQRKGEYVFRPQFEKYMAQAKDLGIDPLIVMSFANPLYDEGKTPYTPEGCDAYGAYGQAILKRFGDQIKWLEVWNEYNGTWCTGPAATDRPKYYAQMLRHANAKIKQVRPDVTVLGGAAVLQPLPYFEGIFKHDGLSHMDAAVIHPYRGNPEGVDQDTNDLQNLAKQHNDGKGVPIWATETGLIDQSPGGRERVARYLVRQYTLLLSANVEKIYWYLCRDYDQFKSMGLLHDPKSPLGKYVPAPAYVAYANLIRQLNGAKFVGRDSVGEHAYVQQFRTKDQPVRVCWATVPAHVAFNAAGPVTLVDMMGRERVLTPADGQIALTLTDAPVYLKGDATPAAEARFTIAADQTVDVADQLRVRYSYDNRGGKDNVVGAISVLGVSYPFACKAGEKFEGELVLANQPTTQAEIRTYWYDLTVNGKLAGSGGVLTRVADAIVLAREPALATDRSLRLSLANRATRVPYPITGVAWTVAGAPAQQAIDLSVPAGSAVDFYLPVKAMTPYQAVPVTVTTSFAGRAPVIFSAPMSYNPVPLRKIDVDGDTQDWTDAASMVADSSAFVAYDAEYLYLATRGYPEGVTVGVAASDAKRSGSDPAGWYELRVTTTGVQTILGPGVTAATDVAGAKVKSQGSGDATTIEVAIPWQAIQPIQPQDRELRMALAAGEKALFGDGIVRGKTPLLYRICRLVDPSQPLGDSSTATATMSKLSTSGTGLADGGKVIADSFQDYSNTQGRNGWSYGFYAGDGHGKGDGTQPSGPYTDDDFQPMKFVETMWGYEWAYAPIQYMKLTPGGGHPGATNGRPVWAIRRWVSPLEGLVRITGKVNRFNDDGDGVDGKVVVDGVIAWTQTAGGPGRAKSVDCDVTVKVKKGSIVDFGITPGPAASTEYDAAEFGMQIRELPSR